eukprot:g3649.t1
MNRFFTSDRDRVSRRRMIPHAQTFQGRAREGVGALLQPEREAPSTFARIVPAPAIPSPSSAQKRCAEHAPTGPPKGYWDNERELKCRRNKGVMNGPALMDNIWGIMESNKDASMAPEPLKKQSHVKFYKNGHVSIFGRNKTARERNGGKEHFMVRKSPASSTKSRANGKAGGVAVTRSSTDHLWDVLRNAAYAAPKHSSIRAHYHNQDHVAGVLPGPRR